MKKVFISAILTIGYLSGTAQILDILNPEIYHGRVKLVSEFMKRFNGDEINPYIDKQSDDIEKSNLCQLFDIDYIMNNRQIAEPKAFQFIDSVIQNNVKIHYSDAEWFAKVKCIGNFNGKDVEFSMYLTVEPRGKDMYKWVISDVEGKIFNLTPSKESEKIMLLPNEHESNFMRLHSITSGKDDYITLYSSNSLPQNRLAVFNTLVYYGYLNIDYVSDIEYTFLQVPGYIFTIRELVRESTNSGWLISDWTEMADSDKQTIMQRLFNGTYSKRETIVQKSEPSKISSGTEAGEAIAMVKSFIDYLNGYLKDKRDLEDIYKSVKGRYTFIIADELSNQLAKYYNTKAQKSYRLDSLLDWLGKPDCPIESIKISNAEHFINDNIRPNYAIGYTLIKGTLQTSGMIHLKEDVVFFIYENQIAGIKFISDCF